MQPLFQTTDQSTPNHCLFISKQVAKRWASTRSWLDLGGGSTGDEVPWVLAFCSMVVVGDGFFWWSLLDCCFVLASFIRWRLRRLGGLGRSLGWDWWLIWFKEVTQRTPSTPEAPTSTHFVALDLWDRWTLKDFFWPWSWHAKYPFCMLHCYSLHCNIFCILVSSELNSWYKGLEIKM